MTVNFEHMSMQIDSSAQFLLHRCSTPSYIQEPENVLSTKWVWYWKDDDGWKKYAKTKVDSILLLDFSQHLNVQKCYIITRPVRLIHTFFEVFAEFTSKLSIGKQKGH